MEKLDEANRKKDKAGRSGKATQVSGTPTKLQGLLHQPCTPPATAEDEHFRCTPVTCKAPGISDRASLDLDAGTQTSLPRQEQGSTCREAGHGTGQRWGDSPMQELGKLRHWEEVPEISDWCCREPLCDEKCAADPRDQPCPYHICSCSGVSRARAPRHQGVTSPRRPAAGGLRGAWPGAARPRRECFWQRRRGERAAQCICWAANRWLGSGAVTVPFAAWPFCSTALSLQRGMGTPDTRDTAVRSLGRYMRWVPALERVPNTN